MREVFLLLRFYLMSSALGRIAAYQLFLNVNCCWCLGVNLSSDGEAIQCLLGQICTSGCNLFFRVTTFWRNFLTGVLFFVKTWIYLMPVWCSLRWISFVSLFWESLSNWFSSNIFLFSLSSLFSIPNMKSNSSRLCKCELLYLSEVGGQRHSILFAHMKLALEIFFFSLKIC